jgi:phosphoribosylformylglycinamidine synthase
MELPIRHAEGKFYASPSVIEKLFDTNQVVFQYVTPDGELANNRFPYNPNGSLRDIAGICDSTGRIFGLMPHPEAYNHFTNHPNWTYRKIAAKRHGGTIKFEGDGIRIFSNAVEYINANF